MRKTIVLLASVALAVLLAIGVAMIEPVGPARAAFPGQNGRIAFFSERATPDNPERDWEIFSMDPDGSAIKQLTFNDSLDWEPAISPDSRRIAFWSARDGNNEIYVMNADGTGQSRLTNNPASDRYPVFSPDGNRIIFQSERDGNWEIYAMNADGSGTPTNLTENPSDDGEPAVSPDAKIAFVSWRDGLGEIYVMNSDGSNQTRLTYDSLFASNLNYSPDGRNITFHSARDGDYEIYLVNSNGSNLTNLTNSPARETHPGPSPDGRKIAFESTRHGNQEIYTMNWDGSYWTRLTNSPKGDAGPDWQVKTAPRVRDTVPQRGATQVGADTVVEAFFSRGMDPETINVNSFRLYERGSTTRLAATVAYDTQERKATLIPSALLKEGTIYSARVNWLSRDLAGNRLDQDQSLEGNQRMVWRFTVGN